MEYYGFLEFSDIHGRLESKQTTRHVAVELIFLFVCIFDVTPCFCMWKALESFRTYYKHTWQMLFLDVFGFSPAQAPTERERRGERRAKESMSISTEARIERGWCLYVDGHFAGLTM